MRIMGLDFGSKTIGVAMSDALFWTAQGVKTIRRSKKELDELRELIREYEVMEIVIGYPKNMNGTLGPRCTLTEEFAEVLRAEFGLEVKLWDERLSTVAAQRTLIEADVSRSKRKHVIDKMAAVFILQGYLDSRQNKNTSAIFDNHYLQ
ncbi:Holliday junction resolvase RuvX [Desulfosporosinus sp.]|uniref:Holliday junction resolvase RuvX n=1 Tax=Desulfosporosinus sp. TaxID=157907 RepID=UPI00230D1234|nr:Holliday junction resolvase RuvX [Desulfosporosinus sp.]MCO5387042.1 Holliday junction resolvase RuvX [Desulfosporosinus sp.]MDA8223384.1 Holliday junction resolvase RuvX [Desulfitobacterium hafniense]